MVNISFRRQEVEFLRRNYQCLNINNFIACGSTIVVTRHVCTVIAAYGVINIARLDMADNNSYHHKQDLEYT